jgi:IS5 family transposase
MRGDPGFFDIDVRLGELSAKGDDLERLKGIVDFEIFRADLERTVPRADRAKGGRPRLRPARVAHGRCRSW